MNLISNAVKFTLDGKITVTAWLKDPRIKHSTATSSNVGKLLEADKMGKLFVKVSDTGVGIPKGEQCKLFRDFATLSSNAHLNPNGVGLGLSTSKKIVNLLHGDITVESTENQGSCFTFHVAFNPSPDHAEDTPRGKDERTVGEASLIQISNGPELPTDFSLLIGRMQAVYKQFQTQHSDLNMNLTISPEDIKMVFGPLPSNLMSLRRMMVVDD